MATPTVSPAPESGRATRSSSRSRSSARRAELRRCEPLFLRSRCLSDGAVALVEEVRPRHNVGVLFEQCPALALGHATPDAILDLVVERVRRALLHYGAVTADGRGLALCGPAHKEFVGISGRA